jgi:hypothetical protein
MKINGDQLGSMVINQSKKRLFSKERTALIYKKEGAESTGCGEIDSGG